ncbi:bestrophin family ion channel [Achromobacter xylosoxidans]
MIIRPASRSPWLLLFTLKGSIVSIIWKRVVAMMLLATAVVLAEHRLPLSGVGLGAVPLTLVGLTLAIFLGFRNSVAYERWWEARTLWGELLIVVRNLARQTLSFPTICPRRASVNWCTAWSPTPMRCGTCSAAAIPRRISRAGCRPTPRPAS